MSSEAGRRSRVKSSKRSAWWEACRWRGVKWASLFYRSMGTLLKILMKIKKPDKRGKEGKKKDIPYFHRH